MGCVVGGGSCGSLHYRAQIVSQLVHRPGGLAAYIYAWPAWM